MNSSEVSALLTWLAEADARLRPGDDSSARTKELVWGDLLAKVPFDFTLMKCRHYYHVAQQQAITPAYLLADWERHESRERERAARQASEERIAACDVCGSDGKREAVYEILGKVRHVMVICEHPRVAGSLASK